mgnify:CR=1 FL=1
MRPSLLLLAGDGTTSALPLHFPEGGYAASARWAGVAVSGDRVIALGGAPGGAHANTRWTIWRGTLGGGVTNEPQPFETFGGEDAGGLVAVIPTAAGATAGAAASDPGTDLVVGSWASTGVGNDIMLWRSEGDRWQRQRTLDTPLAHTATFLPEAQAAAATPEMILIVGWYADLSHGVSSHPALWWAARLDGPWQRLDLPVGPGGGSGQGQANRLACDGSTCLVVGTAGNPAGAPTLSGWWVSTRSGRPEVRSAQLPSRPVLGEHLVTPVVVQERGVVVLASSDRAGSEIVRVGVDSTAVSAGPPASPSAVTVWGQHIYVATGESSGATIWRTSLP